MTDTKHAKLGASKSARWLACAGTIRLEALCPPQPDNIYAAEGTLAHECMERILKEEINREWAGFEYGEDIATNVDVIINYVNAEAAMSYTSAVYVEERVDCSEVFGEPDEFGTVDVAIYIRGEHLEIIDYKHGKSVVEVKNNTQLLYYAIGMAYKFKFRFKKITMTIVQPRAYHAMGPIRSWTISVKELKTWIEVFKKGIARTKETDAPLVAGKWCYWCPAKMICSAYETKRQHELFDKIEEVQDEKES